MVRAVSVELTISRAATYNRVCCMIAKWWLVLLNTVENVLKRDQYTCALLNAKRRLDAHVTLHSSCNLVPERCGPCKCLRIWVGVT